MTEVGPMGMPFTDAGEIVQSITRILEDRGFDHDDLKKRLSKWAYTGGEDRWWDRWGGPAIDNLAYELGYDSAFPEGS